MNNNKSKVFLIMLNVMLAFFFFRLFDLQIIGHYKYSQIASDNAAHITPIIAPRGIVFDRYGKVLLKNQPVFKLYLLPHLLPKDPMPVFERLSAIVKMPASEIAKTFKESKTPIFEGILVNSNLSPQAVSLIEESRANLPGVETICYPLRLYSYPKIASHVLGFVGELGPEELKDSKEEGYKLGDLIGKDGLEKTYDKYLRGVSGGKKIEVNAHGRPMRVLEIVDPLPGNNAILTLDVQLQIKVEEILGRNEGAVVVLNPNNGEVLAMASHPSFDANKKWSEMDQRNHPFMNRALSSYPPGSIFKVVTLSAALETGIATIKETMNCPGFYQIGKRIAKCWKTTGHGRVSILEGLVWSCDIIFYELGRRIGPEKLYEYAVKYGLGQKTGIDLPQEKKGFVPNTEWKKERFGQGWYDGDSINMGIGQGYTQVTPLQMACLYGEIATGKRYKPYVLKMIVDKSNKILVENKPELVQEKPIKESNLMLIREALQNVVLRGTGVAAFVSGMEAAGKTGTAENPGLPHAWFVCFGPTQKPEIVIAAFVVHGQHGDQVTARIAHDILKWYKENRLKEKYEERQRPAQYIKH